MFKHRRAEPGCGFLTLSAGRLSVPRRKGHSKDHLHSYSGTPSPVGEKLQGHASRPGGILPPGDSGPCLRTSVIVITTGQGTSSAEGVSRGAAQPPQRPGTAR